MSVHVQAALARKTLGPGGLFTFGAAASAPMVVLAGGIVATYAGTQVVSLPLVFLIVGTVVALLAVGYTAMSRRIPHAAVHYAVLARGLRPEAGVAGGAVALLSYNAIQISLYGLFGATMSGLVGGVWWAWAGIALLVVALLGVRAIALSTRLLATILVLSLLVVLIFDVSSLVGSQAGADTWQGFSVSGLFTGGIGGAIALCLAAFMGVESPASFSEEASEDTAVTRSVFSGILMLALVYSLAAWAMGLAVGPNDVAGVAADPNGGLPFAVMEERIGGFMTPLAQTVLIFAIVTSLLAFHSVCARYAFAIAREGVLPAALARTGSGTRVSAPVGGSLLQTGIALVVVGAFAVAGADPVASLFTWLSTLGALGLLCLLLAASVATIAYFARAREDRPGLWASVVAPLLGLGLGGVVLAAMVTNMGSLLGTATGSLGAYLLPLIIVVAALVGLWWGSYLRRARPQVYEGISRGRPEVYEVPDDVGVNFNF
jgi:amino acid transporter